MTYYADTNLDEVDEADDIVKTAEADNSDEAIESDEADDANKVNEAIAIELLALFLPFSLTNNYAIFAEVKEFFGINNNQLGGPFGGNDIDSQLGTV